MPFSAECEPRSPRISGRGCLGYSHPMVESKSGTANDLRLSSIVSLYKHKSKSQQMSSKQPLHSKCRTTLENINITIHNVRQNIFQTYSTNSRTLLATSGFGSLLDVVLPDREAFPHWVLLTSSSSTWDYFIRLCSGKLPARKLGVGVRLWIAYAEGRVA